jgi:hypothetical protein
MSFFRELDLYKVIILVSLLLLPVAVGFVYWVDGQLATARAAIDAAERPNSGELEKIGLLQRQLQTVAQNAAAVRTSGGSAAVFFQNQITTSSSGTVGSNDYEVSPEARSAVPQRRDAQDQVVTISFNKALALTRGFVHALIFNVESSGAQVWKLRQLNMRNAALAKLRNQAPPKTVADDWEVVALKFARREPATQR